MSDPAPARRIFGDRLTLAWVAAIVLLLAATFVFHSPFGSTGPAAPPRWSGLWPGRGPVRVPGGWEDKRKGFWVGRERDRGAVVFAGDSITDWWGGLDRAFPEVKVANRGIAGDTSRGLLFRFREDVLDLEPRAIVILIGTNDLMLGAEPGDVAANVRDLLDAAAAARPGTPVVLCGVMPRERRPPYFPDRILALNALLAEAAKDRQGVAFCDTWTPLADADGAARAEEFPDQLHPNAAGYAKWAEALRPVLKAAGVLP